jgi:hypothetical protein
MKRPRGTGSMFRYKGCGIWYLKFYKNGIAVRESSHSDRRKVAEKLLARRLSEISTDTYVAATDRKGEAPQGAFRGNPGAGGHHRQAECVCGPLPSARVVECNHQPGLGSPAQGLQPGA